MEKITSIMKEMGVVPKLKLGIRLIKQDGKPGGVKSTGEHKVMFLSEPVIVSGKTFDGRPQKQLKFIVEENGKKFKWNIPITNKEGNDAHYLLEKLEQVKVGDVRILEMRKSGANNYVDVRMENEASEAPEEVDEEYADDSIEALEKELAKE